MNDKLHPALAEHAMEAELQLERERHRKTWRQLEQVTGLLQRSLDYFTEPGMPEDLLQEYRTALSQQAEPIGAAKPDQLIESAPIGLAKPGSLSVTPLSEPAPAQDERSASGVTIEKDMFGTVHIKLGDFDYIQIQYQYPYTDNASQNVLAKRIVELLTRPAQTEQQPIRMPPSPYMPGVEPESMTDYERGEAQGRCDIWEEVRSMNAAPIAQTEQPEHFDDRAVDRFAAAMKAKLAKARGKGRGGWFDRLQCSEKRLAQMLVEHLRKGNEGTFEDVANFAMMLHQRGEDPQVLADAAEAPIKKARGEALELGVRALESKVAQPEQSGLVAKLERCKLTNEESKHHSFAGATYWNNAVTACIAVLSAQGSSSDE